MRFLIAVLMSAGLLVAAPRSKNWENLGELSAGERVEVVTNNGNVDGEFVSSSTESLNIRINGSEQRIVRHDVVRVVARSRSHRLRNALIGAGAGLVLGIIADQSIGTFLRNESDPAGVRPVLYAVPIGVGGGIGALIPSHPVIYRK